MSADCVRLTEIYEHRVRLELRINGQHAVSAGLTRASSFKLSLTGKSAWQSAADFCDS
jgi:hypothetical protein